jgi:beta-lactamase class D
MAGMRMLSLATLALALAASLAAGAATEDTWTERPDWARHFTSAGVRGTMVVADQRAKAHWVHDAARARARFLPASTFKVPHALFALDAGVVRDEFETFPWDGTRRDIESWNRDQDLRSSMRNSTVWVYQLFARRIGEAREREYLEKVGYGNADATGGVDRFWLDGGLRISAVEQVAFLQRLFRNDLPFRVEHQRLVKDVMINEAGRVWILRAKTGWAARAEHQVGWWVGWVERPDGAVFFALNIDMAGAADAPKREAIGRAVLAEIGALPAGNAGR